MVYCTPMLRLFKTWLILLLITAVPLHAATAGIGLACASTPASSATPNLAASAPAAMPMAPCHGHAAMPAVTAAAETTAQADDSGTQSQHAACSACSAACLGAFMPPPVPGALSLLAGAENVHIAAMPLLPGIIPDGLRRPPRHLRS